VESGLAPGLALAHGVAIALVVVGGDARREEVSFVIARQLGTLQPALGQHGNPRLAARPKKLRYGALGSAWHGKRVEWRIDVGTQGSGPAHKFCRQEAAGRNVDTLVVDRHRALPRSIYVLLCLLEAEGRIADIGLQVGHIGFEVAHSLLLL